MSKTLSDYDGIIFTSNEGYDFIIVQYLGNKQIEIEFIETGFKRWTRTSDINAGKVRDMIEYNQRKDDKQHKKVIQQQEDFGKREARRKKQILHKVPKAWLQPNQYKKIIYDIGFYGNVNKSLSYYNKARNLWSGIIRRCYSGDGKDDSYFLYAGVCKRWYCLENFMNDLPNIIGFDLWLSRTDMQLDKDLLSNQKIYAPSTCIFLEATVNSQLNDKDKLSLARERISQGLINWIPANKLHVKHQTQTWKEFISNNT